MTRAAAFKPSDVTRAIKGVVDASLQVAKVEIDAQGKIVVFIGAVESRGPTNPWDEELDK